MGAIYQHVDTTHHSPNTKHHSPLPMLKINIGKDQLLVSKNLFHKYNEEFIDDNNDMTMDGDIRVVQIIIDFIKGHSVVHRIDTFKVWTTIKDLLIKYKLPKLWVELQHSLPFYLVQIGYQDFKLSKKWVEIDNDEQGPKFDWENNPFHPNMSASIFSHLYESLSIHHSLLQTHTPVSLPTGLHPVQLDVLLQYCQFFKLFRLKQALTPFKIQLNPFDDNLSELRIPLKHLDKSHITLKHGRNQITNACTTTCSSNSPDSLSSDTDDNERQTQTPQRKKQRTCKVKRTWDIIKYSLPSTSGRSSSTPPYELVFQMDNNNETSLVFNKSSKSIHIDLIGETMSQFESLFTDTFQKEQITLNNCKFKFAKQTNGRELTHLILPACISICHLTVNDIPCRNITQLINDTTYNERIIDFSTMNYTQGVTLNLNQSLWKCGVKDGKIMMIAIKACAVTNIKEFNKLTQFI